MKKILASIFMILVLVACVPQSMQATETTGESPTQLMRLTATAEDGLPQSTQATATSDDSLLSTASGVRGQALIGPACPVMREGQECPDQPYQTQLVILTRDGRAVTRFETDEQGRFEVRLPPGDYILHPDIPVGKPLILSAADVPFTVIPNEFTNIIITFDSGIR